MILRKGLVLDFGTLIHALMPESKVLPLMEKYETEVDFRTPEVCFDMASRALGQTLERHGFDPGYASTALEQLSKLVQRHWKRCLGRVAVRSDWIQVAGAPSGPTPVPQFPAGFTPGKLWIDYEF
jgi:hypothetical protein